MNLIDVITILALVIGPSIAVAISRAMEKRVNRPKWSTSGIEGTFEKRDDGIISNITL